MQSAFTCSSAFSPFLRFSLSYDTEEAHSAHAFLFLVSPAAPALPQASFLRLLFHPTVCPPAAILPLTADCRPLAADRPPLTLNPRAPPPSVLRSVLWQPVHAGRADVSLNVARVLSLWRHERPLPPLPDARGGTHRTRARCQGGALPSLPSSRHLFCACHRVVSPRGAPGRSSRCPRITSPPTRCRACRPT